MMHQLQNLKWIQEYRKNNSEEKVNRNLVNHWQSSTVSLWCQKIIIKTIKYFFVMINIIKSRDGLLRCHIYYVYQWLGFLVQHFPIRHLWDSQNRTFHFTPTLKLGHLLSMCKTKTKSAPRHPRGQKIDICESKPDKGVSPTYQL